MTSTNQDNDTLVNQLMILTLRLWMIKRGLGTGKNNSESVKPKSGVIISRLDENTFLFVFKALEDVKCI